MPPNKRGTRPMGPGPWPRRAEEYRRDAYDAAGEILKRVEIVRDCPQRNIYLTQKILAEIARDAEYIQRVLTEARLLGSTVAAEPAELDDLAELIRDEVARQLAELLASDPPALRLLRKAE